MALLESLQGDTATYYDVANSLLPHVLLSKRGIPITLCIIHAAVGSRAGLNIGGESRPMLKKDGAYKYWATRVLGPERTLSDVTRWLQ